MNWTTLICFGAGIAIYLIGLGIFTLIKRSVNKKKFNKELKEHEEKIKNEQNQNSTDQVSGTSAENE